MSNEFKYTLCIKKTINDFDLDSYLPFLDYEVCNEPEQWCKLHAPTAEIHRGIISEDTYLYITWYIVFTNKEDYTLFALTR